MKINTLKTGLLAAVLLLAGALQAQPPYTERADPRNPRRKIVELQPYQRRLPQTLNLRNILDTDDEKRAPVTHVPFEVKNPRTGKPLDPNKTMTIKMPDGTERKTTVQEFFAQVNELEKKMNQRGRSLRQPNSLNGLRVRPPLTRYQQQPPPRRQYARSNFRLLPPENKSGGGNTGGPLINIGKISTPNIGAITSGMDWGPQLYISESTSGFGTVEFPAVWVKSNLANLGQKTFPFLVELPAGFAALVKKITWQLSATPFDNNLKDVNVPGVMKTGTYNPSWYTNPRGSDILPNQKTSKYTDFSISMADIPYPANDKIDVYFIRVICYDAAGEVIKTAPQVVMQYGASTPDLPIPATLPASVPNFNYAFPESDDVPFGVYIKGSGLQTYKSQIYYSKSKKSVTTGYKVSADAALGIRYFNFLSIVNSSEPKSKEFNLVKARFTGIAGTGPGLMLPNESNGVKLTLTALDGLVPPVSYEFKETVPGNKTIALDYSFKQDIDVDLINTRFMIGPVPIKIAASLKGKAGVNISGMFNANNYQVTGQIEPFIETSFKAEGGVDAVIAYAKLEALINPLLNLSMPLRFNSMGDKPVSFTTDLRGLTGGVRLKAGFYYPCPSLEKIVGWLSGDEELPLCECSWEFNIFSFDGFEYITEY